MTAGNGRHPLPTIEERVSYLEGQLSEQSHALQELRSDIRRLDTRMDARFDVVDRRFEALEGKMSTQFLWLVGIQITTLVAIVGALLARS